MHREVHIASFIVQAKPDRARCVHGAIADQGLGEVAASDGTGRLVVLIERASTTELTRAMSAIDGLPSVMSVTLAYHHVESEAALAEVIV